MHYPEEIMADVPWIFEEPKFSTQAEFVDAVHQHHREFEEEIVWQPEAVVLPFRRVRVEHGFDDDEGGIEFTADHASGFTAGELLFKVHNAFVEELQELDHRFFEGFSLLEASEGDEPPLYEIDLGS